MEYTCEREHISAHRSIREHLHRVANGGGDTHWLVFAEGDPEACFQSKVSRTSLPKICSGSSTPRGQRVLLSSQCFCDIDSG